MAPPTVTLSTLISRVRNRADMVGSTFVADSATEMYAFINEGCQKLHEKMVMAYGDEYLESSATLSAAASTYYTLPNDFFKLYDVDLAWGSNQRTLEPYSRAERNRLLANTLAIPKYRIVGNQLRILPLQTATVTIRYAPIFTLLTSGSDTVSFPNGWERYAVCYAAIQCLAKEESDTSKLDQELARMEAELEQIKHDRDAGFPQSAVDRERMNYDVDFLWR